MRELHELIKQRHEEQQAEQQAKVDAAWDGIKYALEEGIVEYVAMPGDKFPGQIVYRLRLKYAVRNVMTATEAADRWGVGAATVNHACAGQHGYPPRFTDEECRKSKGTWLVTKAGMERLYGKEVSECDGNTSTENEGV